MNTHISEEQTKTKLKRILTVPIRLSWRFYLLLPKEAREAEVARLLKFKKYNLYPSTICCECAKKRKLPLKGYATFYHSLCDVCQEGDAVCTEVRDYGYPDIWISYK